MQGYYYLKELSKEFQDKIDTEFGSIEKLYKLVFDFNNSMYVLFLKREVNLNYSTQNQSIENKIYEIENKLNDFGVDGDFITREIRNDFGEIIVKQNINALNKELEPYGTNFNEMRNWMKNKFGI